MRKDWYFWRFHFIWRPAKSIHAHADMYKYYVDRGFTWWNTNTTRTFDFTTKRGMFTVVFATKQEAIIKGHRLEHSKQVVFNTHDREKCAGEFCTIHNMSNHSMRKFPQSWREDRRIMERICPHGIGHPDPDEVYLYGKWDSTHGCDGCCGDGEQE